MAPRTAFCGHGVGRLFHGPPDVPWPRANRGTKRGGAAVPQRKGDRHKKKLSKNVVFTKIGTCKLWFGESISTLQVLMKEWLVFLIIFVGFAILWYSEGLGQQRKPMSAHVSSICQKPRDISVWGSISSIDLSSSESPRLFFSTSPKVAIRSYVLSEAN